MKLPLSDSHDTLGDSYHTARAKLLALEQRLLKQLQLKKDYSQFLDEYLQVGHMTPVDEVEGKEEGPKLYMPHHGIVKKTSSNTKLRVVFNGAEKSSNGVSLNEIMMAGQQAQDDLFDIVQRFRFPK